MHRTCMTPSEHARLIINGLTSAVSMGTITTSLLEGRGRCIDTNIHTVLFGRGRSHLSKEGRQIPSKSGGFPSERSNGAEQK